MDSATTWFVMLRDVSKSIRLQGETRLAACMVVEMETGDVLCIQMGKSEDEALSMTLEGAALCPAGPRSHRLPDRIGFGTKFAPLIARRIRELGPRLGLDSAELVEGVAAMEAEERFDRFLGHMAGRSQPPGEYASSEEWHMLLELALTYTDRQPWKRWGDDVDLHLDVELEGRGGPGPRLSRPHRTYGSAWSSGGVALDRGHGRLHHVEPVVVSPAHRPGGHQRLTRQSTPAVGECAASSRSSAALRGW